MFVAAPLARDLDSLAVARLESASDEDVLAQMSTLRHELSSIPDLSIDDVTGLGPDVPVGTRGDGAWAASHHGVTLAVDAGSFTVSLPSGRMVTDRERPAPVDDESPELADTWTPDAPAPVGALPEAPQLPDAAPPPKGSRTDREAAERTGTPPREPSRPRTPQTPPPSAPADPAADQPWYADVEPPATSPPDPSPTPPSSGAGEQDEPGDRWWDT